MHFVNKYLKLSSYINVNVRIYDITLKSSLITTLKKIWNSNPCKIMLRMDSTAYLFVLGNLGENVFDLLSIYLWKKWGVGFFMEEEGRKRRTKQRDGDDYGLLFLQSSFIGQKNEYSNWLKVLLFWFIRLFAPNTLFINNIG